MYIPNRIENTFMQNCTWVFTAARFIIVKKCKQHKFPSADEWINILGNYIHAVEC